MNTEDLIALAHTVPGVVCGDQHGPNCVRVRDAMLAVVQFEVNRAVNIAHEARDFSARSASQARQKGDQPAHQHFVAMANMFHVASLRIALPPDGCVECLNVRQVPSRLAPGQLVPCECTRAVVAG